MGYGGYSTERRTIRAANRGYETKSADQIFSRTLNQQMSPNGVLLREARDSDEHPNSYPIILGLDVTGSMGHIPHDLIKGSLPKYVSTILERGFKSPQVMFLAIGDHLRDNHPLQVGQFESSDELMDKWLESVYIEEGGGGNGAESYHLAWFFASRYTAIDSFEKRGVKGLIITIGDDAVHGDLSDGIQRKLMGTGEYTHLTTDELLKSAQERYNVYHIHVAYTGTGADPRVLASWRRLLGENVVVANSTADITKLLIEITMQHSVSVPQSDVNKTTVAPSTPDVVVEPTPGTEILL